MTKLGQWNEHLIPPDDHRSQWNEHVNPPDDHRSQRKDHFFLQMINGADQMGGSFVPLLISVKEIGNRGRIFDAAVMPTRRTGRCRLKSLPDH